MSNVEHQPLPELRITDESLKAQAESLRKEVESHAQKCVDYTQYYFFREKKDFNAFVTEVSKEPFNIQIDASSPTSVATGIFDLQHLLGMRLEPGYKDSCDGKFGPTTNKKFEARKDAFIRAAKLHALQTAVQPTLAALATQTVRPAETVPAQPTIVPQAPLGPIESRNTLPEKPISKTLFVGDSLTVGMQSTKAIDGSLRPQNYDRKVWTDEEGKVHERWKGIAIGGQQTTAMRDALKHAEDANELTNGERMVVWGGVNDIASARSPEAIIKTLTEIYQLAGKHNMSIVACTITPWKPTEKTMKSLNARWMKKLDKPYPYTAEQLIQHIEKVNTWIRTQAATTVPGKQFAVVDLHTEVATHEKEYPQISDNLHFSSNGSKNIAAYIRAKGNIN